MVRLKFRDAVTWRYVIAAISKIIEETSISINEDGVRLKAIDPSYTSLVDFYVPATAFTEYELSGKEVLVSINLEDLSKVLKRARSSDELVLEPGVGKLVVALVGRGVRKFSLPSLEASVEEVPEISFEKAFRGKLPPTSLASILRELKTIGDEIEFSVKSGGDGLVVKSSSEIAEAEVVLNFSSGVFIEYEVLADASSKYTIDYLADISPVGKVAEYVTLSFGDKTPIELQYDLPLGGSLKFYVAPRGE